MDTERPQSDDRGLGGGAPPTDKLARFGEQTSNAMHQVVDVERLPNAAGNAQFSGGRLGPARAGEEDDRRLEATGAELAMKGDAIHAGHLQVKHNELDLVVHQIESLQSVPSCDDAKPLALQHVHDELSQGSVILHHKQKRSRHRTSLRGQRWGVGPTTMTHPGRCRVTNLSQSTGNRVDVERPVSESGHYRADPTGLEHLAPRTCRGSLPMTVPLPLVLIVNQSAGTLSLLRSVIEESGFHALTLNWAATDADSVRAFLIEHRPDVVIFDIPWPYEENYDAFVEIHRATSDEPIKWLLISTSDAVIRAASELGSPAITKPFELDDLMERVAALAGVRATSPEE